MWNKQSPLKMLINSLRMLSAGLLAAGSVFTLLTPLGRGGKIAAATVAAVGIAAAIGVAAVAWKHDLWALGGGLRRSSGIVRTEEYAVGRGALAAVETVAAPLASLLGAARVNICTAGQTEKNRKRSSLLVTKSAAKEICGRLMPQDSGYRRVYKASGRGIVLLALSESDFLSGLLLVVPSVLWLQRNIDLTLTEALYSALEQAGRAMLPQLSSVAAVIAVLPIAGWMLHLIYNLLSVGRFCLKRSGESITVTRGLTTVRKLRFNRRDVAAVLIKQGLLGAAAGVYSAEVFVTGYGNCTLVPAENERNIKIETAAVFPHGERGMNIKTECAAGWWRWWLTGAAAAAMVTVRLSADAGEWRVAVLLGSLPIAAVLLWRAAAGALTGSNAEVQLYSDSVELVGIRGMKMCRMRVPRGGVAEARTVQNPIQRTNGLCSLYIRPRGAKRGLWCRYLPVSRCHALLRRLG